jgi:hypothetical protein
VDGRTQHSIYRRFKPCSVQEIMPDVVTVAGEPETFLWSDHHLLWGSVNDTIPSPAPSYALNSSTERKRIEDDFFFVFTFLFGMAIVTSLPLWMQHKCTKYQRDPVIDEQAIRYNQLLQTYLPAYLLAACADWLQGPHKYALYSSYGYSHHEIALLYIVGYGSG